MKNSLQGQLDDDVLANLLQYLSLNRASGSLQLRNPRGLVGEVFFEGGKVVHVEVGKHEGVAALSILLTWNAGSFNFRAHVPTPQRSIKLSLDSLLLEAAYQVDVSEMSVTTFDRSSILVPASGNQGQNTVAMTLRSLHLLRQLDGKRTLEEIALAMGEPADELVAIAEELSQQALVDFAKSPTVNQSFVDDLTRLVVEIMGPIAEIVIEDTFYDLGLNAEELPQTMLGELLRELRVQLKRDDWQREFDYQSRQLCEKHGLSP